MHPDLAASRSSTILTPNLAKLASEGIRFSAAYAPSPVCSPTRISLHYPENASPRSVGKFESSGLEDKLIGRAAITYDLDQGVGDLLKVIDTLDIADSTYLIYMSDNGSGGGGGKGGKAGGRSIQGGKGSLWECGIRVPLTVRGPGIPPNSWNHQRVVGYDLYNIRNDIEETKNLAKEQPEKAQEFDRRLTTYLTSVKAQLPESDPQTIEGKTYAGKEGGKPAKKDRKPKAERVQGR